MHEGVAPGTVISRNGLGRLRDGGPIRRVLFFGKNMSRTRCTGALVEGLRSQGLEVEWVNMATLRRRRGAERARAQARQVFTSFRPDLVFVFCRDLPLDLLEEFRRTCRTVSWVEDLLPEPDDGLVDYMRHADLVCMSALRHHETLHQRGVDNIVFLLSGFSPRYHYPVRKRLVRDVAFIGGPGVCGQRARFLSRISEHYHTEVFGVRRQWERWEQHYPNLRVRGPLRNAAYRRVCASSRIVLGLNEVNDVPLYFSNRTFLTLGCGAFHLTHYVPGLETVFGNGEHLVWYRDEQECLDRIEHYVRADDERRAIAAAGHEFALSEHQYSHRVDSILQIVAGGAPVLLRPRLPLGGAVLPSSSLSLASGGG